MGEFEPDLVISDILTLAPTLAAEVAGVPHATLIPHVYPVQEAGMPLYSLGFQPPRTPLGRVGWRATMPILGAGCGGDGTINRTGERLGLAPLGGFTGDQRAAGGGGDLSPAGVSAAVAGERAGERAALLRARG